MIRFFRRSGAIASAAVLIALFSGAGLSGAIAQDDVTLAPPAPMQAQESELRFIAEPVVQPIFEAEETQTAPTSTTLRALVSEMAVDGELSAELSCLAQAVYFEARGEPLDGQLAVARVIINRTESGMFPEDYCSVVTQRGQFSFVRGGSIPTPNLSSVAWRNARAIARIAHQDLWDSRAGNSLYFHNTAVRPGWARRKATVARIDSHIFYR
jgi:spore germination cell wall hydrolase CwlJ-like protein